MVRRTVVALGVLLGSALALPVAPAQADSFSFGYSSGYYPRHHYHHPRHYHRPRVVYVAPPVYYYPPPPPRVVYVEPRPAPVYVQPSAPVSYGTVVPGGPLVDRTQCREYQSTAVVNGQQVPSYGTACLQPDGSWRIVR